MSEQVIYVFSYHALEEPVYQAGRMDVWERPAKYYKIGIAKDVDSRLSVLGTGTPHRLKKYTTIKSDKPTPDNPAFPVTPELGKRVSEWCEEQGIEPAWVDGPAERDDL